MPRRTPILAFLLAPVALILVMWLWTRAVIPLARTVWYSDAVLEWRLNGRQPATRIAAARALATKGTDDPELLAQLVARFESDPSLEVRQAAAGTLGHLGSNRTLPAAAVEALSRAVSSAQETALLSAVVAAVGRSAAQNRYPDAVVERILQGVDDDARAALRPTAITALGQIGAAQPLPATAFESLNALLADPQRRGEHESVLQALTEIAKGQSLPPTSFGLLANALENEPDPRLRRAAIYALAHAAADQPAAVDLIVAATADPDASVASAAENGLRILEYNRDFKDREPLSLATDHSQPLEVRLGALRILRASPLAPAAFEPIAALAQDPEVEVAVAALEMFRYLARDPDDDFDQRVLIPTLTRATSDPDPKIREAAFGALSMISIHRPAYLSAGPLPARLEAGTQDPAPRVRVVAMAATLRQGDRGQRQAILEKGLSDPDPYVRSMAVTWLASPKFSFRQRQQLLRRALEDADPNVRASATAAREDWESRRRTWPIELWRLWQAGERGKVGLRILTAVTVATPILICAGFLLYYVARLLTLLAQRRWRAAAVVAVVAVWAAASYGMFLLYFLAAHTGDADGGELAVLVAVLWGAIAAYTTLGWGLHFAVRR